MSHVVQIKTEVREMSVVKRVARRLGLTQEPAERSVRLYSGQASGIAVELPGWKYPVVFDVKTGEAKYDNYNGSWGAQQHLDKFLQLYPIEAAKQMAELNGHTYQEQTLEDGREQLVISIPE